MESIKDKLRKDYPNIDSLSDVEIRKIVSDIWSKYLEENHAYLIINLGPDLFIPDKEGDAISRNIEGNTFNFTVLNDAFIENNKGLDNYGLIIDIYWNSADPLHLPSDFISERDYREGKQITSKYLIKKVYALDTGIGILNGGYEVGKIFSEELGLEFLSVPDKRVIDKRTIIHSVIGYILFNEDHMNISLKEELASKYGSYIYKRYQELIQSGSFNDEEFIKEITNYIHTKEGLNHKI